MIYIYDGGSLSVTEEEKKDFYSSSIRLGFAKITNYHVFASFIRIFATITWGFQISVQKLQTMGRSLEEELDHHRFFHPIPGDNDGDGAGGYG